MEDNTLNPPPTPARMESSGETPGFFQRIINVFVSPSAAFAGRLPATAWILPLILLAALQTFEGHMLRPLTVERMRERISQTDMSQEMREKALEGIEGQSDGGVVSEILGFVGGLVGFFCLGLALPALLYWLGTNFVCGGSARFWGIVSTVGLASLVYVPKSILTLPMKLHQQSLDVYTSLALLPVGEIGSKLRNALNVFDIFDVWYVIVVGIGLALVAKIRPGQGLGIAVTIWAIWALIRIAVAFLVTGTQWGAFIGL
ncbi:MAG: hypothetical protein KJ970_12090 [Candidatus Eisenbacteria bacterium]|uniref:Yip1 domain-containing protein n=1 Tax=Eiseniibacteriota bacterium TaxID=2212470 RepID=A0A948W3Z8_UNCEI|nr:hypothetical protein [Candidatus Eisenbacteria bacterium]MBU1949091.1 hypothetical protein [Candidatus Eisenbacteria bacterium]MBU2691657.1 hypothetical protein [Candidatus Eisenbacteria bacterium]